VILAFFAIFTRSALFFVRRTQSQLEDAMKVNLKPINTCRAFNNFSSVSDVFKQ
jgi:hypothetical protein